MTVFTANKWSSETQAWLVFQAAAAEAARKRAKEEAAAAKVRQGKCLCCNTFVLAPVPGLPFHHVNVDLVPWFACTHRRHLLITETEVAVGSYSSTLCKVSPFLKEKMLQMP